MVVHYWSADKKKLNEVNSEGRKEKEPFLKSKWPISWQKRVKAPGRKLLYTKDLRSFNLRGHTNRALHFLAYFSPLPHESNGDTGSTPPE
jgi:hypothetical protein